MFEEFKNRKIKTVNVHISHMEKELYNAYEDDLITYEQFKELNEEKD